MGRRGGPSRPCVPFWPACCCPPPCPSAQAPKEEELEKAGRIASQPARDVGISKRKVPPVLQEAVKKPYAVPRRQDCRWLNYELARLNQALGPDFDVEDKSDEDKVEQLAYAGGEMIVNSLIPFRGLVREISGAGPADRRRTAAINAGLARRGYLRGLATAKSCASSAMAAAE
ncbi:hypothetical protein [Sphingobium sp. SYK-6]|uniref:hypothetical protein n=1 Tax=Sphingobium sp. (strain NBRC 103272 / SYK-6) TaxID=627192 RepID=UPI001E611654|nr:hypothetical protein [Sphingobium sp. SYK-6]